MSARPLASRRHGRPDAGGSDVAAFRFFARGPGFLLRPLGAVGALRRGGCRPCLGHRRLRGVSTARRCAAGGGGCQSRSSGCGRRHAASLRCPGSASVALATALAPLHALAGLERAEVATYQAVSGSGRGAMDELAGETVAMLSGKKARGRAFGRQIAFNVIPQVDSAGGGRRFARGASLVAGNPARARSARTWRSTPPRCACRCFLAIASRSTPRSTRSLSVAEATGVLQRGTGI